MSSKNVYLAINNTRFVIGQLKKRGDFFTITNFQENLGALYNPSKLYVFITSFLQENNLEGARAIVCCPFLAHYAGLKRKLALFQIVLCVNKTGLQIEHVFDEELF